MSINLAMIRGLCAGLALALAAPVSGFAAEPAKSAEAAADEVYHLQFRDLFIAGGKPSRTATALSGKTIELVGFLAPPPEETSPFYVLVGAPTTFCPYCTTANEQDHLPFVLIYADQVPEGMGLRTRLRVSGRLDAGHTYEGVYGIHNDLRLLDAKIERDARSTRRQARAETRPAAPNQVPANRTVVNPAEIDD